MIKDIFSIYTNRLLKKENGGSKDRFLKAGKVFSKYIIQMKTTSFGNNNEKKNEKKKIKKTPYIIDDIVPEISLFLTYKDLREYMAINKRFKALIDNNLFWKRKFISEFKYKFYPKILENNLKKGWKYATIEFLKMKDNRMDLSNFKIKELIEPENELLFITVIRNVRPRYSKLRKWIRRYIRNNNKLNDQFLIDIINYNVDIFKVISLYPNPKKYSKKKVFLEYLKKMRTNMWWSKGVEKMDELIMTLYTKKIEVFEDIFNEKYLLKAVTVNGIMLKYLIFLNKDYSKNKELILEALESTDIIFKYVHLDLQDDKNFVLQAVGTNGEVLKHLSTEFKDDTDIVRKAINQASSSFKYASERFRDSIYAFNLILKKPFYMEYAGPKLKNDVNIFYNIVKDKDDLNFLRHMGEDLKNNLEFAWNMIKNVGTGAANYFPNRLFFRT